MKTGFHQLMQHINDFNLGIAYAIVNMMFLSFEPGSFQPVGKGNIWALTNQSIHNVFTV